MKKYLLLPPIVLVVILLARLCCYTVDAAEYAYVTVLGEHQTTFDGANQANGAGLKVGLPWPILQVQRLDRRLQHFDLPPTEQLTHDPDGNTVDKILLLEAYVCWKISDADGVDLFVKSVGTAARARDILAPEITGKLGAAIGQKRMDDFITVSTDPETGKPKVDVTVEKLRNDLIAGLKARLRDKYGIDLVDIRLRRFNHPVSVRNSIFDRIKSERSKEAERYESEGKLKAANTISKAEEEVRLARAKANTEAEKIKADADVAAMRIRSQAYAQDKEFAEFLKRMESLQSIVGGEKSMLLLSTHWPMFESFFKEPRPKVSEKDKKNEK